MQSHPFLRVCRALALSVLCLLPLAALQPILAQNNAVLKVGVIPYDAPSKLMEQYTPFANYLGAKTGRKAQVFVAQDYVGVAQALQANQIDCAYLNPLSYVLFEQRMRKTPQHLIPVSMPEVHGSLYYYGIIVTRKDTGIRTIAGLKGKRFAFSEPTSTSGYLYPFQYLRSHGLDPNRDFSAKIFAGTPAVIPSLLHHQVDAGAVFEEGLSMFTHSPAERNSLLVLARVGPIANGMFVIRGNLDPATIAKIRAAMQMINTDPLGKQANAALQVTKWDKANDSVFDPVRQAASILGVNIQSMDRKK